MTKWLFTAATLEKTRKNWEDANTDGIRERFDISFQVKNSHRIIVEAGVDVESGGDPCGRLP